MAYIAPFAYKPDDHESEKASNGYLMFVVALVAGLPLPIINLIATVIYYLNNLKSTFFVRWHCTQALLSQFLLIAMNTVGFWWTIAIIKDNKVIDNSYIAYIITILLFNLAEFIMTIYAAVNTRKGKHVVWWFFGPLTDLICKPK